MLVQQYARNMRTSYCIFSIWYCIAVETSQTKSNSGNIGNQMPRTTGNISGERSLFLFCFSLPFLFQCLSFHFFTINEIIKSYNKIYYKRTKNIASSGPDPPDAHMVVTARTGSGRDHHKVTRVWNYHQVKAWYQTLYQRL